MMAMMLHQETNTQRLNGIHSPLSISISLKWLFVCVSYFVQVFVFGCVVHQYHNLRSNQLVFNGTNTDKSMRGGVSECEGATEVKD